MFKDFFSKLGLVKMETFNMMIMFQNMVSEISNETWEGTVKSIKKHVSQQIQDLKIKLYTKFACKIQEEI